MQTFGAMVATARASSGLSLAKVAAGLGVSVPYVHDVETGKRPLAPTRWVALVALLPSLDLQRLAVARLTEATVTLDARALATGHREALARAIVAAVLETPSDAPTPHRRGGAKGSGS